MSGVLKDRLGRKTTRVYDELNRIKTTISSDKTITYNYDAVGRIIRILDNQNGGIQWEYDESGQLVKESTSQGDITVSYNQAGQRETLKTPDQPIIVYVYDEAGRLTTIKQGTEIFDYAYNQLSQITSLERPNNVKTIYKYDEANRPIQLTHINNQNQAIEELKLVFNLEDEISASTTLYYTPLLPNETQIGNANNANRIQKFGSVQFEFDAAGQTVKRIDLDGTTHFGWDSLGRLIKVILPNGETVNYNYDALGRRISRHYGEETITFLYDGEEIVAEKRSEGDQITYLNGPGIDERLKQTGRQGTFYYLQDNQGNVSTLLNKDGTVAERIQYEPFGLGMSSSLTRFGYTGREHDEITNLIYFRSRWYDPKQGRFLSEDTIGFKSLQENFYVYAANNPIKYIDPFGQIVYIGRRCTKLRLSDIGINNPGTLEEKLRQALKEAIDESKKCCKDWDTLKKLAFEDTEIPIIFQCKKKNKDAITCVDEIVGEPFLFYPDAFKEEKDGCGCLKATVYHELLHVLYDHYNEKQVRRLEKSCFKCAGK